mgnify:CR=1 FL=1
MRRQRKGTIGSNIIDRIKEEYAKCNLGIQDIGGEIHGKNTRCRNHGAGFNI